MMMWSLARRSAWAHRAGLTGTVIVLALAGFLLAVAGVLAQSGLGSGGPDDGLLLVLASSFTGTLIVIVVLVLVATIGLALQGRRRELALLRAVGATRAQLRTQVGVEVGLAGLVAVPFGAVFGVFGSQFLEPLLREAGFLDAAGSLSVGPLPVLGATIVVLPVVWLSAWFASRETLRAPPGRAVRESTVETRGVGQSRRVAAVVVALFGLAAAFSPLVVPGTIGAASAGTSAFLLVGAAALAGPILIAWSFDRMAWLDRHLGPPGRLATGNLRGFSRRLTAVVVPLALALSTGAVQTTVNSTVAEAGEVQLRDGLNADLVATSPAGLPAEAVESIPGVSGSTTLNSATVQVLTDPDLAGVVDALAWESTTVRSLTPGVTGYVVDPKVTAGSLDDLRGSDTVAVSSDTTFETRLQIGSTVPLRWADGTTSNPTVVAVYERGLGFGSYLVGPRGLDGHSSRFESVVINVASGSSADVGRHLANLGMEAVSVPSYAQTATDAGAADRRLSTVLLLAMLAFVFLAAANVLVMVTVRRRPEFSLYSRTGATHTQLWCMSIIEALLTGGLAWLIGTLTVIPAVVGVSLGLLGPVIPPVDLTTYLALSAAVVAVPLLTVVPTAVSMMLVTSDGRSRR